MTVSCTITGSGLESSEEVICEGEVETRRIKGLAADDIAVGGPGAGKTAGSTEGILLVEGRVASGEEVVPRGRFGKGWGLTA